MKRVLVVSDTHGQADLIAIARIAKDCDMVLHLGDGFADGQKLSVMQPAPVIQVLGNADLPLLIVPEKMLEIEGWNVMITHGHRYRVKRDLVELIGHADDMEADLVLFGHLHKRAYEEAGRVKAFCPSSAAYTYDGSPPSVGVLEFHPAEIKTSWIEVSTGDQPV